MINLAAEKQRNLTLTSVVFESEYDTEAVKNAIIFNFNKCCI